MIGLMGVTIYVLVAFRLLVVAVYLFVVTATATTEDAGSTKTERTNRVRPVTVCSPGSNSLPLPNEKTGPPRCVEHDEEMQSKSYARCPAAHSSTSRPHITDSSFRGLGFL